MSGVMTSTTAMLHVITGASTGVSFRVGPSGLTLGRSVPGAGRIDGDQFISGEHARVRWNGGRLYVENVSSNGTLVNDRPVSNAYLNDGDVITIGWSQIEVELPRPGVTTAPPFTTSDASGQPAIAPASYTTSLHGGQEATSGGVIVGGPNQGTIKTKVKRTQKVYVDDELSWWARARGPARVAVLIGLVLGLVGFGLLGYPIVSNIASAAQESAAVQQCWDTLTGSALQKCIQKASAAHPMTVQLADYLPQGAALFFSGMVVMVIARLLPGANPKRA
jgi:pSer/pThr/pTyr-binding forkhead associated (FHA) protein